MNGIRDWIGTMLLSLAEMKSMGVEEIIKPLGDKATSSMTYYCCCLKILKSKLVVVNCHLYDCVEDGNIFHHSLLIAGETLNCELSLLGEWQSLSSKISLFMC